MTLITKKATGTVDRKVVIATVRWDHLSILPWEIYLVRYEGFPRASSL